MGIFDDIKAKGAAYRLTEEALYAEAFREIEAGQRRDGIWAKAMAESNMDKGKAGAKYIKLRVQSLKDETTVFIKVMSLAIVEQPKPVIAEQPKPVIEEQWKIVRHDRHSCGGTMTHKMMGNKNYKSCNTCKAIVEWTSANAGY